MQLDFPYAIDRLGRTATADEPGHVRDMLEMLLFTRPGERPNRPDFGTGLAELVFAPLSPELAAAVELAVRSAIERWLGDVVEIGRLEVTAEESMLTVELDYAIRATGEIRRESFRSAGP
jgi:phage baseplate assembly protein W